MVDQLKAAGYAPLPDTKIMEKISIAYLEVIAAQAGIACVIPNKDVDFGVDATLHVHQYYDDRGHSRLFKQGKVVLDCQVKATINCKDAEDHIRYSLDATTHRQLSTQNREGTPIVLIVVCLPRDRNLWVESSVHEYLMVRRSGYFYFVDEEPTSNSRSYTISIPKAQCLDPMSLVALMQEAAERMRR